MAVCVVLAILKSYPADIHGGGGMVFKICFMGEQFCYVSSIQYAERVLAPEAAAFLEFPGSSEKIVNLSEKI